MPVEMIELEEVAISEVSDEVLEKTVMTAWAGKSECSAALTRSNCNGC